MEHERSSPQDWREWRRLRAWELEQQGWAPRDIAEALGVSRAAVSQWLSAAAEGGPGVLRSRLHPGPAGKLLPGQKELIADFLWHGAEAYGFRGDVWTCDRLRQVIQEEFGVTYHKHHVARILKDIGWTPQVPITRAIQRNEKEIQRWRDEVWPELKCRAIRERRTLVFVDDLGHQIKGAALVVWDRSPIHRRVAVQEFIAAVGAKNLHVELLPPYAPDLNPVEWLWRQLKKVELRNLSCRDLEDLHEEFHLAIGRIRGKPRLFPSFFAGAELPL